jgi:hypothetical protein
VIDDAYFPRGGPVTGYPSSPPTLDLDLSFGQPLSIMAFCARCWAAGRYFKSSRQLACRQFCVKALAYSSGQSLFSRTTLLRRISRGVKLYKALGISRLCYLGICITSPCNKLNLLTRKSGLGTFTKRGMARVNRTLSIFRTFGILAAACRVIRNDWLDYSGLAWRSADWVLLLVYSHQK